MSCLDNLLTTLVGALTAPHPTPVLEQESRATKGARHLMCIHMVLVKQTAVGLFHRELRVPP